MRAPRVLHSDFELNTCAGVEPGVIAPRLYIMGLDTQATSLCPTGEPNRLVYGVDSWGMTCGTKNTLFNLTFDLTEARNLYYFK